MNNNIKKIGIFLLAFIISLIVLVLLFLLEAIIRKQFISEAGVGGEASYAPLLLIGFIILFSAIISVLITYKGLLGLKYSIGLISLFFILLLGYNSYKEYHRDQITLQEAILRMEKCRTDILADPSKKDFYRYYDGTIDTYCYGVFAQRLKLFKISDNRKQDHTQITVTSEKPSNWNRICNPRSSCRYFVYVQADIGR